MHGQPISTRKKDRLKAKLRFDEKTKVVGIIEVYNFNEGNFFKFKTDFKIKLDLKN